MGLFGRKEKVIDLSEDYHIESKSLAQLKSKQKPQVSQISSEGLGFLGGLASSASSSPSSGFDDAFDSNVSVDERKKKLAKRLIEMNNRIEDLSTQIYHLQQRIDLLEKKLRIDSRD